MSNINDTATVELFVNGEQAKQTMERLRKEAEKLTNAIEEAKAGGKNKEANKLQRELEKVNNDLKKTESAAKGVGIVLDNLSNSSIQGLRNALKYLEKELRATKPNTESWQRYASQIELVKGRIAELNEEVEGSGGYWKKFKGWALGAWPAIDLLRQWSGSAFDIMRDAVDAYASMDQEMANVRKFTGMTEAQVASLNDEFKKIDTRTFREDLNKLAQEAGRLGKSSKEDVLGFVRAADKINVALDDLGEGATLTLSKLTGVFGDEARYGTEQSLLKVGSVINELSQNCSASAPYLAQFASRMGGVGAQAKMTIPQIMAFGAVLDSNGQAVEASSTALSLVIVRMMQEPAKYAKVAGLDVKKFSDMLKTDVNGALIMFLETLQKAGGMDVLSPMFKDMGENGSRAIAALSTLATHIDDVKAQQSAANVAFAEGTSVTKEFEVQNNTVQASIEKAKNAMNDLRVELGERLSPLMSHMISSSSAIIRALVTLTEFIFEHKTALISLTAGIAAYNVAINIASIKTAVHIAWTKALNAVYALTYLAATAAAGSMALLTGNTTRATAAFKLFSAAIKTNPIGLAASIITTAVVALGSWIKKVHDAREAERQLARERALQQAEYRKQISNISSVAGNYAKSELDRLKQLYKATQDQTKSQKERLAAVRELQKTYPTAFGNLSQEKILAGQAASAYNDLAQKIIKAARAKAAAEKIKENEKQLLDFDLERDELEQSIRDDSDLLDKALVRRKTYGKQLSNKYKFSVSGPSKAERRTLNSLGTTVDVLNDKLDTSAERLEEIIIKSGELTQTNNKLAEIAGDPSEIAPDINFNAPTGLQMPGEGYESQTVAEKERKKKAAEAKREATKAKKEFKAVLDSYKAQRSAADREVLELYKSGSIDYEQLLERRHQNEDAYYEKSLSHFEKTFEKQKDIYLEDDKDYQKLLLDREKADEKYNKDRIALRLEAINREKAEKERSAQQDFDVRSNPTLADEIALQAELYAIRRKALDDTLALYPEGSKEYADVQYNISQLEKEKELNLNALFFKSVSALRKEYDKKSAAEKFEMEKATLDKLHELHKITDEEYARYLKGLQAKYKPELPGDSKLAERENSDNKYDADVAALKSSLEKQLITQMEFNERMASLDKERRDKMLAGLRETGGEWNAMAVDIYSSFAELFDSLGGPADNVLAKVANCVGAVSAAVSAGMQIATEFAKAESEIQLHAVEKRYDREIELAQGNSYKVAKLEKKKEAETAKIKNEAAKKQYAMQVIQAIAQTAQNAIAAYGAGLQVGGPAGLVIAPIAAALAAAAGAVQITLIKKQQQASEAQGYAQGGFTKPGAVNEPAGIVHAGEWVASQKLLASPVARPMIEALDYAQRTNTIGSLKPDDVSRSIRASDSLARIAEGDSSAALVVAAVAQNAKAVSDLNARLNEPFVTVNTVTGDRGIKKAQDDYSRLINNVTPKSKRR